MPAIPSKPDEKPDVQPAPTTPEKQRRPAIGDSVRFVGWVSSEGPLHGVVSRVYGVSTANIAYLTPGGTWMSATSVKYDPSGKEGGTWHWPPDRG